LGTSSLVLKKRTKESEGGGRKRRNRFRATSDPSLVRCGRGQCRLGAKKKRVRKEVLDNTTKKAGKQSRISLFMIEKKKRRRIKGKSEPKLH